MLTLQGDLYWDELANVLAAPLNDDGDIVDIDNSVLVRLTDLSTGDSLLILPQNFKDVLSSQSAIEEKKFEFDPDEPRDESGKWTSGGSSLGGERKLSDDHIQQLAIETKARQAVADGFDEGVRIDVKDWPVGDRLALLKEGESDNDHLWISNKRYSDRVLREKWDKFTKDVAEMSSADTLKEGLKRGLFSLTKDGDFTYRSGSSHLYGDNFIKGLNENERSVFEDGFIKIHNKEIPGSSAPYTLHVAELKDAGWSDKDIERFSDKLYDSGARGWKFDDSWESDDAKETGRSRYTGSDIQASHLSFYSKDYDTFRAGLYNGWAITGGSDASAIARRISEEAFYDKNNKFYNYSKDADAAYSPRAVEHIKQLKAETEQFYMTKLKTKDLSSKPLNLYRGVGGHAQAYTPGAAESWTKDERVAKAFGKLMSKADKYSILNAPTTYADVLWSYEVAAGKPGWPTEKNLKGKKEHVILGGRIKNIQVNHQ